jgi:hypothetical protein
MARVSIRGRCSKFQVVEVNLKKKKRSRCGLCGEQWWDIGPSFILDHMGFEPGREVRVQNLKKYAKCAKINDPETPFGGRSVLWSTPTRCA